MHTLPGRTRRPRVSNCACARRQRLPGKTKIPATLVPSTGRPPAGRTSLRPDAPPAPRLDRPVKPRFLLLTLALSAGLIALAGCKKAPEPAPPTPGAVTPPPEGETADQFV